MRNKKGFISMSLIYTFFIILVAMLVYILATYTHNVNTLKIFKDDIINNIEGNKIGAGYGGQGANGWDEDCNLSSAKLNCRIVRNQKTLSKIRSESVENPLKFYEAEKGDDGNLYYAIDNLGPVYFFRGNVTNNYVFFSGYYWRILRINGDGTVRMVLDDPVLSYDSCKVTNYGGNYCDTFSIDLRANGNKSDVLDYLERKAICDNSNINEATLSYENIFVCSKYKDNGYGQTVSSYTHRLGLVDLIAAGGHIVDKNNNFFLKTKIKTDFSSANDYFYNKKYPYHGKDWWLRNEINNPTYTTLKISRHGDVYYYPLNEEDYYVRVSNDGDSYIRQPEYDIGSGNNHYYERLVVTVKSNVLVSSQIDANGNLVYPDGTYGNPYKLELP